MPSGSTEKKHSHWVADAQINLGLKPLSRCLFNEDIGPIMSVRKVIQSTQPFLSPDIYKLAVCLFVSDSESQQLHETPTHQTKRFKVL